MDQNRMTENIVSQIRGSIPLKTAKVLMDRVEEYARQKGLACVIAVDDAHGNPIAVHVMEDAFLVSYEVATQKAYTAVAVKMSTMQVHEMIQPGGTFYGLESMNNGRIIGFGGGVPLKIGDKIVGGLGVSGGTGEQDNDVAEFGLKVFAEITGQAWRVPEPKAPGLLTSGELQVQVLGIGVLNRYITSSLEFIEPIKESIIELMEHHGG